MSFFGRLRRFYPAFALIYVSAVRVILYWLTGLQTQACTFIFGTQCLKLVNAPVTVTATFLTQTLVSNFIERGAIWPISQDILVFHLLLSVGLGALSYGLKLAYKTKNDDKDPVLQAILGGSLLYTMLVFTMSSPFEAPGPVGPKSSTPGFFSTLMTTLLQTVVTIFVTGWIKVFLDIKRGATSIGELQAGFEDERTWMHKKLGVDNRAGLFPESQGPRRRQRENATSDTGHY